MIVRGLNIDAGEYITFNFYYNVIEETIQQHLWHLMPWLAILLVIFGAGFLISLRFTTDKEKIKPISIAGVACIVFGIIFGFAYFITPMVV